MVELEVDVASYTANDEVIMDKDSDNKRKTPTIADIMKVLDRIAADREAEREASKIEDKKRQEEADKRQADAEKRQEEADKRQADAEKRQEEADKRQADAEKRQEEADKRQADAEKRQAESDKQLQSLKEELRSVGEYVKEVGKNVGNVRNQWGDIAEYLVAGDFSNIIKEHFGIDIKRTLHSFGGKHGGKNWEIDAFATNDDVVIIGEVKLTLTKDAIDKFVNGSLSDFYLYFPELHGHKKIYGVIAFVQVPRKVNEEELINYAHSLGLLVVKAINDTYHLLTSQKQGLKDYGVAKQ